MQNYLTHWPGKSAQAGGLEHPAVYHMLDVAAVAERLLQLFRFPPGLRDALVLLVALHDLGKIGRGFRDMIRLGTQQTLKHWELTEVWLFPDAGLRDRLGANESVWRELVAAVAGHHGKPSRKDEDFFARYRADAGPEADLDVPAIIADLSALWPGASLAGLKPGEARRLSWWLSGLTVVADWVGSNPEWFPAHPPDLTPADYLAQARVQAPKAVEQAGLQPAMLREGPLFDFALRPMQAAAREIALPDGPRGDKPSTAPSTLRITACSPRPRG